MKIKVLKTDLEAALQVAEIGIAGTGSDLSTHYLFLYRDDVLWIMSFDRRICAQFPLKCEVEGKDGDAFTIEGKRLNRWLGGVREEEITFENRGDGDIAISSQRSTIEIPSLDPSKFPVWEESLSKASPIATLASDRLASALTYAKNFISDKDSTRPEISQVEVIDGALWSTDKKAVSLISMGDLAESSMRIHGKDVPSVTKFLGLKETDDVEILEGERNVFLRRGDGATIGASRPIASFPKLTIDRDGDDAIYWVIKKEELTAAIQCLTAAADWESTRLRFGFNADSGEVVVAVKTLSGKDNVYPITCIEAEGTDDLPDGGFWLDYPYLQDVINHFKGDTLRFGINSRGKGGYVRFRHLIDSDDFLTVVVWRI